MNTFWQDLIFAARMLSKKRGFAFVAVLTLALGIGANTAIFSVVEGLLLRPLPFLEPDRLVMVTEVGRDGKRANISYPDFSDWRERAQSFEGMASIRSQTFNLTGIDRPLRARGRTVNWNFFHVLGVQPQLGRLFATEDDRYGAPRTAILSHAMWQEQFGGDTGVIGQKIMLDGESYDVVGVLPPGFEYFRADDLYVPIGPFLVPQTGMTSRGSSFGMTAVARLKPGIMPAQASRELAGIAAQLEQEYADTNTGKSAQAEPLQDVMSEGVRLSLWVLLAAVAFILLIACVNVANLLLVRAADRQKEMALRLALGASRWRLIRQLLSESLLMALLGGGFGVLIGRWMLDGLLALAPDNIPQLKEVGLNGTVLLAMLGLSVLASVLCGLLPAAHASRTNLQTALKEGGRASAGGTRDVWRKTLLVSEVSLALVLLIGAGLLLRSMISVLNVERGFASDHLLTMRVSLPREGYRVPRRLSFYNDCLTRLEALPGVRSAALTISLPVDGSYWDAAIFAADKPVPPTPELPEAALVPVSASYFETMGIRLLQGRGFTPSDTSESPHVTVINESLAQRLWPGENPIGKRLRHGWPEIDTPWRQVIGVVSDVKLDGVEQVTPLQAYLPLTQESWSNFSIVVRTTGDPRQATAAVEREIHALDKDLPVFSIRSMEQLLGLSWAQRRLTLILLVSLAVLALVLAAVGIYGVMAYSVKQRTHEFGIRLALGAQTADVLRLILLHGLKLALLGVGIGLAAAFVLTRWMATLLFEVRPTDPITFTVIAIGLTGVALLACYLPARRATNVNPMEALRYE